VSIKFSNLTLETLMISDSSLLIKTANKSTKLVGIVNAIIYNRFDGHVLHDSLLMPIIFELFTGATPYAITWCMTGFGSVTVSVSFVCHIRIIGSVETAESRKN